MCGRGTLVVWMFTRLDGLVRSDDNLMCEWRAGNMEKMMNQSSPHQPLYRHRGNEK